MPVELHETYLLDDPPEYDPAHFGRGRNRMLISSLKDLRRPRRVTQKCVADAAGMSQSRVAMFEKHGVLPGDQNALVLAYGALCGLTLTLASLQRLQKGLPVEVDVPADAIDTAAPVAAVA